MAEYKGSKQAQYAQCRPDVFDPITRASLTEKVIELRRSVVPWRTIAVDLGIGPATALRWYKEALAAEVNHESRADALAVELDACNALQAAWWGRATGTDMIDGIPILDEKAAGIVLRVMERRAKLMGLDSPIQIEIGEPADVVAAAIVAHMAKRSEAIDVESHELGA
jgi:hypothetical protein